MFSASIKTHSVNHSQLILQISESMCSMNLVGVYLQYLTLSYLPPFLNLESACRETNKRNQKQRERENVSRGFFCFYAKPFLENLASCSIIVVVVVVIDVVRKVVANVVKSAAVVDVEKIRCCCPTTVETAPLLQSDDSPCGLSNAGNVKKGIKALIGLI